MAEKNVAARSIETQRMREHRHYDPKVYMAWFNMMDRCYNKAHWNYPNYGERGITVCERWHVFANFFEDMGLPPSKQHSLDRYPDNNGNYEPSNCRWATAAQQLRNRRNTLLVPWEGEMIPAVDLAVILGKDPLTFARYVWQRIHRQGYSPEDAIRDDDGRTGERRRQNSTLLRIRGGDIISLQDAAQQLGIDYKTMNQRRYRGASLADALGIPDDELEVIQEVRRPRNAVRKQ